MDQTARTPISTVRHRTPLPVKLLVAATFVVILNETVLINATPRLMGYFDVDLRTVQWLNTAFMLTMAAVIPLTGWLLQQLTTRTTYSVAMITFCLGTALAAVAPIFEVLIAARVVQAIGTAVMVPLLMTTIMNTVDSSDRGRVMGQVTLVTAAAPALGPPASGLILQLGSWRLIFVITLVVGVVVGYFGARMMPNIGQKQSTPVSWLSVVLGATSLSTLVYGISRIGAQGNAGPVIIIAVGMLIIACFVWYQLRLQERSAPLLDLRTLNHRTFALGLIVMFLGPMAFFGSILLLPLYLQDARGLSELRAGLLVAPGALAMGLLGPQVGKLYDKYGTRPMVQLGAIGVTLAMIGLSFISAATPYALIIVTHIALMSCLAVVFTPIYTLALGSLPQDLYSHGSSLLGSLQQVGGAIGTAGLAVTLQVRSTSLAADGASPVEAFMGGLQWAFALGVALSVMVVIATLWVPRFLPPHDETP